MEISSCRAFGKHNCSRHSQDDPYDSSQDDPYDSSHCHGVVHGSWTGLRRGPWTGLRRGTGVKWSTRCGDKPLFVTALVIYGVNNNLIHVIGRAR